MIFTQGWKHCPSIYVTIWSDEKADSGVHRADWVSEKPHMSLRGAFPAPSLLHSLSTMVTWKILIAAPPKDLCYSWDCQPQIHNCLFFTVSLSCEYDDKLKIIKKSKWIKNLFLFRPSAKHLLNSGSWDFT